MNDITKRANNPLKHPHLEALLWEVQNPLPHWCINYTHFTYLSNPTTPSLSVSLRHPVPTWKVLEYCEIIISHNWKGIYVTTKAKDIAEDKGTSEDILRSPAKRLPVSLDRGHQASFPLEGSLRY